MKAGIPWNRVEKSYRDQEADLVQVQPGQQGLQQHGQGYRHGYGIHGMTRRESVEVLHSLIGPDRTYTAA